MRNAFKNSWLAAFMVAGPLAELAVLIQVIWLVGTLQLGAAVFWILLGWIPAMLIALVVAIPLGIIFMGAAFTYQLSKMWWHALPFTVQKKG